MNRFTSVARVQRFLSAYSSISPYFWSRGHRLTAPEPVSTVTDF